MPRYKKSNIKNIARKMQTRVKILTNNYTAPPLKTQKWIKETLPDKLISFTPIKSIEITRSGRKKALNERQEVYIQELTTSRYSMFRQQTPQTNTVSPYRVHIDSQYDEVHAKSIKQKLDLEDLVEVENFSFDLTLKDLVSRGKRNPTQNALMSHISSQEYLKAFGARLLEKTQHKIEFHWSHRRAWSLNGEQTKENLDATTAGSNYDTLFKVENPIKVLLKEHITTLIHVEGTVKFINKKQRVAESITYHFTWNQGNSCTVIIDPLSLRTPTQDEADIAEMMVRIESR